MSTKIYLLDCDKLKDERAFEEGFAAAPRKRREKIASFKFDKDKRLSLGAWLLVKRLLQEKNISAELSYDENGKPYIDGFPDAFVSISHSGSYALAALSSRPIGADIQINKGCRPAVARRFFHPDERFFIESLPQEERPDAFFKIWCRKESFIKLHGKAALNGFSCLCPEEGRHYIDFTFSGYTCAAYLDRQEEADFTLG